MEDLVAKDERSSEDESSAAKEPPEEASSSESNEADTKRMSVTLRAKELRQLANATKEDSTSANQVIRQAIQVDAIVREAQMKGRRVLVEDEDGNLAEIIPLR